MAEELHFGRAAGRLHIAQPSLSRAVRDFESALGVQLLVRTRRRVELTEAGRALLNDAPVVLATAERCFARTRRAASGELGELSVAFLPSVTGALIPRLVAAFRSAHPDVHVHLAEMLDDPLLAGLSNGQVDVGIVRNHVRDDALSFEPLIDDQIHVVLPLGHRLAQRKTLSYRDLRNESFVLWPRSESSVGYDAVIAGCRRAGFTARIVQECAHPYTTLGLVAAGAGVSVLSSLFRSFRRDVAFVPLARQHGTIYLAWRSDPPSTARDTFVELTRETMRALWPGQADCDSRATTQRLTRGSPSSSGSSSLPISARIGLASHSS